MVMNQTAAGTTIAATSGALSGEGSSFESRKSTPTTGNMNAQTT